MIHKDGASTTMGKQSIPETKEMQIQQDNHGIFGTNHQRRTTIDGPSQTKRNQQMASTNYGQTSQSLPRIWKFLSMFYMKILRTSSSTKQFAEERYTI